MAMNSIPIDLIHEILSRLPAKSAARFRCVSKLWGSMLCNTSITESFLTRFSARPRLLFAVEKEFDWLFYSSAQSQNPYEKSSLVAATDFHMKFSKDTISPSNCSYVSGLIYFAYMWNAKGYRDKSVRAICNPSTGRHAILPLPEGPEPITEGRVESYLGFDPIEKQFKVLLMSTFDYIVSNETVHHIATLGTGEKIKWRNIQCPFSHEPFHEGICINGVLYYKAGKPYKCFPTIVCFDVRSETFKFIDAKCCKIMWCDYTTLINYKGKLGVIILNYDDGVKLHMWVLEDVEKQKWSKRFYDLLDLNEAVRGKKENLYVAPEMTVTGEVVLSMGSYTTKEPFYVFYFNPERKILHSVEIQGFKEEGFNGQSVYTFIDHVEDLRFDIMKKTTATSIILREKQKLKPKITSASSSRQEHQVKTVAHHRPREEKLKSIITTETSISPQEQKLKPTITSASSSRQEHQVKTVAHRPREQLKPKITSASSRQDRGTYESANKFKALCLLDDDEFTITSASSRQEQQVRTVAHSPRGKKLKPTFTSASSRKEHQVRNVDHLQQDRYTYESMTKFMLCSFFLVFFFLFLAFLLRIF